MFIKNKKMYPSWWRGSREFPEIQCAEDTSAIEALKDDPLGFLENRHLQLSDIRIGDFNVPGMMFVLRPGIEKVNLVLEDGIYKLVKSQGGLNAYILPWVENDIVSIRLGTGADLFFTAQLSGCKMYIQGPPKYALNISHANGANQENRRDAISHMDGLFERHRQNTYPTPAMATFGPADYNWLDADRQRELFDPKVMAGQTVNFFGVKKGYVWKFYYQSYHIALKMPDYKPDPQDYLREYGEVRYI